MVSSKEKLQQVLMDLQKECADDRDTTASVSYTHLTLPTNREV